VHIHPLAIVSPRAQLGQNVRVGPFCVVEEGAALGDNCRLESHVVVKRGVVLGANNHVFDGAVLGGPPQHARCPARTGGLRIGDGNVIREFVTVHRALAEDHLTTIGDGNLLMSHVHVAHDCALGKGISVVNNVMLAGHVSVGDQAFISGAVGVHQFCRIGRLAMVGGQAHVNKDVPPFVTVDGATTTVVGLNLIGLRRAGLAREQIDHLKAAYRLIYRSGLAWEEIIERLRAEFADGPAAEFSQFFAGGRRGFTPQRRPALSLRLPDEDEGESLRAAA
jgi:UDP-N-acetylglucosamine acyltransferase